METANTIERLFCYAQSRLTGEAYRSVLMRYEKAKTMAAMNDSLSETAKRLEELSGQMADSEKAPKLMPEYNMRLRSLRVISAIYNDQAKGIERKLAKYQQLCMGKN
ncbi:hypothetical protein KY316_01430 [Candidatus Woesearchaeota archaeon]|nr:hypothetical protein [Candidatus Woesearchaeota archaeon]